MEPRLLQNWWQMVESKDVLNLPPILSSLSLPSHSLAFGYPLFHPPLSSMVNMNSSLLLFLVSLFLWTVAGVTAQTGVYTTCPTFVFITTRGCCDPRLTSYITPISTAVMSQLEGGIHYETE